MKIFSAQLQAVVFIIRQIFFCVMNKTFAIVSAPKIRTAPMMTFQCSLEQP